MRTRLPGAALVLICLALRPSSALAQSTSLESLTRAEIEALAKNPAVSAAIVACKTDRWRVCGDVLPGGGRIVRCLAAKAGSLTPACSSAIMAARDTIAASRGLPARGAVK